MKNIFLILTIVCFTAPHSHGQINDSRTNNQDNDFARGKVQLGAKIGTNYSNVYDSDGESFEANYKFGFVGGLFLAIPIGDLFGIQPELLFSQKGYKAEGILLGQSYEIKRVSNYLDIPLFVTVKPTKSFTFLAGPQYSYLFSQTNKFNNGQTTIEQEQEFDNENLRKNTLCFVGGVDVNLNQFILGGRLGWDLYKNNGDGTTTTPRYKNFWYQLTLGYRI